MNAAVLAALAMAAGACVSHQSSPARPSPLSAKPRITVSALPQTVTNEWRPVAAPPRPPAASAPSNLPPATVLAPASVPASPLPAVTAALTTGVVAAADVGGAYRLRPGDPIVINLRGIPKEDEFENLVDEGGFIKLPYLERVKAAGRTCSQVEDEIERLYVEGKIYRAVSVNVITRLQSYFIQGEVKIPGRVPLTTAVTLLQAIAQAGGYTDYAKEEDVRIIRAGKTNLYNGKELKKFPERDVRIEPGDVINVERKFF